MYGHTVIILIDLSRMEYCVYVCQLNVVTCILIYHIFIPVLFLPIVSEFDNIYKTIENNNKTGLKNIY